MSLITNNNIKNIITHYKDNYRKDYPLKNGDFIQIRDGSIGIYLDGDFCDDNYNYHTIQKLFTNQNIKLYRKGILIFSDKSISEPNSYCFSYLKEITFRGSSYLEPSCEPIYVFPNSGNAKNIKNKTNNEIGEYLYSIAKKLKSV